MARHLRLEYAGAIYHVTVRMLGDWKREENLLFEDDADRTRFLDCLADRVQQFNIRLYLFVLMANHVHLVLETPEGNCSKFMQALTTAYTVYFNLRHKRHGHLLDGRYKAKLVEGDEYLLKLSRYVHLNPVCVGRFKESPIEEKIQHLRAYRWSSYGSYTGQAKALDFVTYGPILGEMIGRRGQWPRRYRAFVESGLAGDDEDLKRALRATPRCIGGEGFRAWVDRQHDELIEKHRRPEDVSFRRAAHPLAPERVLEVLSEVFSLPVDMFKQRRRDSLLRAAGARLLVQYAGLNQRETAAVLGIGSGAAISHQLKKLAGALEKDRKLKRWIGQAEERLLALRAQAGGQR